MADSILRLRVESQEYDNKLKRAAEGIRHLADVAHKGGGELTGLEKAELDYIKALGEMETKSRSAAGQTRELENAFKELTVIYNQLNDVEKADEGGKALAASLETLRQRAISAKAGLTEATQALNGNEAAGSQNSSMLEQLASRFTINVDAIKLFNIGLQAAEGALKVAKDAFFASESNVDEWGRTIQSAQSLYEGFLTSLNNSDFSGFLSRMDDIVKAAREAYDAIDKVNTMKTIQAPRISAQQTENDRIRSMIQTGRYIAPIDGRRNAVFNGREMQNGDRLTAGQIRALEKQLQNGMQSVVSLVGNEVKQTGKAIDAYYNSIAKQNGMSLQEFKKGTSTWEEFDKKIKGYDQYQQWRRDNTFTDMYGNRQVREGNPYQEFKKWGTFRVDKMGENSYNDLVRLIQQRDQQAAQAYGMQSQAYRTMNRAEGFTVRKLMEEVGTTKTTTTRRSTATEEKEMTVQQQIAKLEQEAYTASDERRAEIARQVQELDKVLAKQKEIRDEVHGVVAETKDVKWETGLSGFNQQTMGAWMQGRQGDLSKADYGSKEYKDISGNIADMNAIKTVLDTTIKNAIDTTQVDMTPLWSKMFGETLPDGATASLSEALTKMYEEAFDGVDIDDDSLQAVIDKINEKLKEMGIEPIKIDFTTGGVDKEGKKTEKAWNLAAQAVQNVGSAMNQIEDPAAKVAGTVMQAIASIALGFAMASSNANTAGTGWGWLAWLAAGTAAMATTISTIHSLTGYAEGGIVKGNSYSGDNIMANGGDIGLNAGELVLNRAQTNSLYAQMSDQDGGGGLNVTGVLRGENIFLSANRYAKRSGKGELVTWKR